VLAQLSVNVKKWLERPWLRDRKYSEKADVDKHNAVPEVKHAKYGANIEVFSGLEHRRA